MTAEELDRCEATYSGHPDLHCFHGATYYEVNGKRYCHWHNPQGRASTAERDRLQLKLFWELVKGIQAAHDHLNRPDAIDGSANTSVIRYLDALLTKAKELSP